MSSNVNRKLIGAQNWFRKENKVLAFVIASGLLMILNNGKTSCVFSLLNVNSRNKRILVQWKERKHLLQN